MEDENKVLKAIKYIKIGAVIIILIAIGIFIYTKWQTNENNERLYDYLKKENYSKNNDGIYYKTKKNGDTTITDKALAYNYLFSRTIKTNDENSSYMIAIEYKDNKYTVDYEESGYDRDNNYGMTFQKGTYKNGDFDCKIISDTNFEPRCNIMKKQVENYDKEIKKILKDNKININFIDIKTKKTVKS